ncbi:MAG: hypothetical protein KatS3mg082_2897 [Nitrospiraceae bacterium]|nr:MAG: hypothetical protein KatS3mg082_2897 [Nitrospiraceae bacterium]
MSNAQRFPRSSAVQCRGSSPRTTWLRRSLGWTLYLLMLAGLATGASLSHGQNRQAAESGMGSDDKTVRRELYVPLENLDALLQGGNDSVFLTRDQFEALLARQPGAPPASPPVAATLLSADYTMQVAGQRASIRAVFEVENLGPDPAVVPLPFSGVGLVAGMLDDRPAPLARQSDGSVLLLVEQPGVHRCQLEMVTAVEIDAARQRLRFRLPARPAAQMHVSVPGDVEVKHGVEVIDRAVDSNSNQTRFDWLLPDGPVEVVMSLNNKQLQESSVVFARSVLASELHGAEQRLHVATSLDIVHGAVGRIEVAIDPTAEVNRVELDQPHRWFVRQDGQQRVLVIEFRDAVTQPVAMQALLSLPTALDTEWQFPLFAPLSVTSHTAVVAVVAEPRLRLSRLDGGGRVPLPVELLPPLLPPSLTASGEPSTESLVPIAAFLQPSAMEKPVSAAVELPDSRLSVRATSIYHVGLEGVTVDAALGLRASGQPRHGLDLWLPTDWFVESVEDDSGLVDRFEVHELEDRKRVHVRFTRGLTPDELTVIRLHCRFIPAGWLAQWSEQDVELSPIEVVDADQHVGAIEVLPAADLELQPAEITGLLALNAGERGAFGLQETAHGFAFRFWDPAWTLRLTAQRLDPRSVARVLHILALDRDSVRVHAELIYLVERARSDSFEFSVPIDAPQEISIAPGPGTPAIKESQSEVVDDRRRWSVTLSERAAGRVILLVDFVKPVDLAGVEDYRLPTVRAERVAYQTGALALEGDPELEVEVSQAPPSVDVGELAEAQQSVGRRVIGVYGYLGGADDVIVDVRRLELTSIPPTVIQQAASLVVLAESGQATVAQQLQLRTKADAIECSLPPDARLWSLVVDGRPALPQRAGSRVIVDLPAADQHSTAHEIRLVMAVPMPPLRTRTRLRMPLPTYHPRRGGDGDAIPVVDMELMLVTPDGYCVVDASGTRIDTIQAADSAADELFDSLMAMARSIQASRYGELQMTVSQEVAALDEEARSAPAAPAASVPVDEELQEEMLGLNEMADAVATSEAATDAPVAEGAVAANDAQVVMDFAVPQSGAQPGQLAAPSPATQTPATDGEGSVPEAAPQGDDRAADQTAAPQRTTGRRGQDDFKLQGVRSLDFQVEPDGKLQSFYWRSVGEHGGPEIVLVQHRRFDWLALAVGLAVFGIGLWRMHSPGRWRWLMILLAITWLIPPLTPWMAELTRYRVPILIAIGGLAIAYLLGGVLEGVGEVVSGAVRRILRRTVLRRKLTQRLAPSILLVATVSVLTAGAASAQDTAPPNPDSTSHQSPAAVENLLDALRHLLSDQPVQVPDDAVIIPYDPDAGITGNEKLLVPYQRYLKLMQAASGRTDRPEPPREFTWDGGQLRITLAKDQDAATLRAELRFRQLVDRDIGIPLPLSGGVIAEAEVDGQPARLQSRIPSTKPSQHPAKASEGSLMLRSAGRGEKNAAPARSLARGTAGRLANRRCSCPGRCGQQVVHRWHRGQRSSVSHGRRFDLHRRGRQPAR